MSLKAMAITFETDLQLVRDELADAYGFDDAGKQLKQARERSKLMVGQDQAATCDYVEKNRRNCRAACRGCF